MNKEFKVGIFGIASLVVFYFGFNFLKGEGFFSSMNRYYVIYDNVQGLTASNPVIYKGIEVGSVENISLEKGTDSILVELAIDKSLKIKTNTIADLASMGIMGNKSIVLKESKDKVNTYFHEEDTIRSSVAEDITEVLKKIGMPLASSVDSLLNEFKGTGVALKETMNSFKNTSDELNNLLVQNQGDLNATIKNYNALASKLRYTLKKLDPTLDNFEAISTEFKGNTVPALDSTLNSMKTIMANLENGEGTLGRMLKDDSVYTNMNKSMVSLDSLLIDLKEHPKRYVHFSVFGKKDK